MAEVAANTGGNVLVGIAMAGVPLAVAASISSGIPCAYTRKLSARDDPTMDYGQHRVVEGDLADGDRLVLIDDVATLFDTKRVAMRAIQAEAVAQGISLEIPAVAVVIDREQGAAEEARRAGVELARIARFESEAIPWLADDLTATELRVLTTYLEDPLQFQQPQNRERLLSQ